MIQLNPRHEAIFNPDNIDQDCDRIASLMNVVADFIKEALDAGLYKQAMLLKAAIKQEQFKFCLNFAEREQARPKVKSFCEPFIEDEHWCYFNDMYSPECSLQWIYKDVKKYDIDQEPRKLLGEGHKEFLLSECYEDYGYPSYIDR